MAKTKVKTTVKSTQKVSKPYQRVRGGGAELQKNVK
jgi:hypothetical protein